MYRTIDKNFEIINRFSKNKREQRNKQKGSFEASEENCSWSQKCSWRQSALEVITSSEASSSEASSSESEDHPKLKFIRWYKLKVWKVVQRTQCRLSIAEEWKRGTTAVASFFGDQGYLISFWLTKIFQDFWFKKIWIWLGSRGWLYLGKVLAP